MTKSSVPKPPNPFKDHTLRVLPSGSLLHRIHRSDFGGLEFNPCKGGKTRFAPVSDASGACVSSLYAATSLDAAIYEVIFHDVPFNASVKTVRHQDIIIRSHTILKTTSEIKVVQLFEPDLKKWGTTRSQLIDTFPTTYQHTVAWANAIYQHVPDAAGLIWTSRQCDPDQSLLLFEDRIVAADISIDSVISVPTSPALYQSVYDAGRRAGITIIK